MTDRRAEKVLREFYGPLIDAGTPVVVTDYATAELVKVAANAFLATKISFINAMAEVCEVTGADVVDLADSIGYDARIGRRFLQAGIGFGGGCLPKDIRAFVHRAGELGVEDAMSFLRHVDDVNQRQRERVVHVAQAMVDGDLAGARIAVWGAAFKPDSDDVRDSPALSIAGALSLRGAQVRVYDPRANDTARVAFPTLVYADSAVEACRGADLVLHLTEWPEFRAITPGRPRRCGPPAVSSSTAATSSTSTPGAPPAGPPAPSAATDAESAQTDAENTPSCQVTTRRSVVGRLLPDRLGVPLEGPLGDPLPGVS